MTERLCVQERNGPRHIIKGHATVDFAPILCSDTHGIVLPPPPTRCLPTCPNCIKRMRHRPEENDR